MADRRAVVAPIVGGSRATIDQCELELARAIEIGAAVHDAALIIDDARHLGAGGEGEREAQGDNREAGFHG